jgi:hypothetical protein
MPLHHVTSPDVAISEEEKLVFGDVERRFLSERNHFGLVALRGSLMPLRDSLPLLGAGLLVAVVLLSAGFFAANRDNTLPRGLVMILLIVLAVGAWLLFNWARLLWVQQRAKQNKSSR